MIRPLSGADILKAGGKARGLARLMTMGVKVPDGVVLIPEDDQTWKQELEAYLDTRLPGPVAVRSSALAEDGESASFAGQFESFLNCSSGEEIIKAVESCMNSAGGKRVGSYREHFKVERARVFPVIIQEMIPAVLSGVIFTVNPVSHRSDQWMINVTTGLAEGLMAGTSEGEQILITRNGRLIQKGRLLSEAQVEAIYRDAKTIARISGRPMDLEWAIDDSGDIFWLQARPVTTLKPVHLNELDGDLFVENEVFTRANIGEMMPGPVTPLTWSVFGRAIEVGLQDFYKASGALKDFTDEWLYFRMFYNHLFFSMTRLADISDAVLLNKKENVEFAIMGEMLGDTFGDYRPANPKPLPLRILNQFRQMHYLSSAPKRAKKLRKLAENFMLKEHGDARLLYGELSKSLPLLNEAFAHHYCASSQSGTYQSVIMAVLSGGKEEPGTEHYRDAASLMSQLEEVESADVVKTIDHLYDRFKGEPGVMDYLDGGAGNSTHGLLQEFQSGVSELLGRHGHRCVREGELREKSWSEEPEKFYKLIRKRFLSGDRQEGERDSYLKEKERILSGLGWISRNILMSLLKPARKAVARREYTKSMSVKFQHKIKQGYRELADIMVDKGMLDDADQIYFLTHQELGSYLETGDRKWREVAGERRRLFPAFFSLKFEDVCQGFPEPLPEEPPKIKINGNAVKGLPVSSGAVEAKIRLVKKLSDADLLEKGEIMVCQYTDVGWTPYFSLASGLITEIGSPLSHGAVVAREYGIPAVVNAKGALGFFRDGERVLLDGSTGIVRKVAGDGTV